MLPPSDPLDAASAVTATSNSAQVCCCNTFLFASTLMYARRPDWISRFSCTSLLRIATTEAVTASRPIP
jgi:hypothetical protein